MVRCVETFKTFYEERTSTAAGVDLRARDAHGERRVRRSPSSCRLAVPASALLLFNKENTLSYGGAPVPRCSCRTRTCAALHSLACSSTRSSKSPEGEPSRRRSFRTTPGFDRARRIKVPVPPVEDRKKVLQDVDNDRRYAIDADRAHDEEPQSLAHQKLVLEVVRQLSKGFKRFKSSEAHRGPRASSSTRQGRPERVQLPRVDATSSALRRAACRRERTGGSRGATSG